MYHIEAATESLKLKKYGRMNDGQPSLADSIMLLVRAAHVKGQSKQQRTLAIEHLPKLLDWVRLLNCGNTRKTKPWIPNEVKCPFILVG